jgi:hypothetical protein
MNSSLDSDIRAKKFAQQKLAQQRSQLRQREKLQARLSDDAFKQAQLDKKQAARLRQQEKQQEKINSPAYKAAQQEKLRQTQARAQAKLQLKRSDASFLQQEKDKRIAANKKKQEKKLAAQAQKPRAKAKAAKPSKPNKGLMGRARTAEEKRLEKKLASLGCICCLNKGWYTTAMRSQEGQSYISMHHVEGRTSPWAHAKQLPLCHYHHQSPAPEGAPADLFPLHGSGKNRWEQVNGSQEALMQQAYAMIGEPRPWLEDTIDRVESLEESLA